ncbi:TPA: recombinase family protein [Pseudomonas aeruginosa]|nr:recombinase family protein [Pseudomonas aeruginosa]HBP6057354.1 recombinase family protein [Pseudomonas aeruginosa]HBP6171724.1 recombinase family protein [Pseudomonas aeruginosa]HBP6484374.1 recombinase family protein [Pseudomonas aeruginosa]
MQTFIGSEDDRRASRLRKAAAYVRMSTEHQQYSTENQLDTIRLYAAAHDLEISRTYTDSGKSGLRLEGRDALKQLFDDVENGLADYSTILVYDVSRWGRFQDPDVSASYEVRCRQAGVSVQYCAEQFTNDGSPVSNIIKSVKRMMAGEYSRELSVKVFAGQSRLIELGYRQGGPAGFGLRRQLIDANGTPKGVLDSGKHKSIQTDRVVLVPGPDDEIEIVQWIYRLFVEEGRSEREISDWLNTRGVLTDRVRPWTRGTIHQVLINEKYIGNNVWNRCSFKLKQQRVRNKQDEWIRADGAFLPIVNSVLFRAAQEIIQSRSYRMSDEEMLNKLLEIYARNGYLSGLIIDETEGCPSSSAYQHRFGSLLRSYALIGYTPQRDYEYIEANRRLRQMHPTLLQRVIGDISAAGGHVVIDPKTDLIQLNEELIISLVLCRCQTSASGARRWKIRFDLSAAPDITVAVRMIEGEESPLDYYVLPTIDIVSSHLRLAESNPSSLEIYRFDNLQILAELSRRSAYRRVA